VAEIVGYNDDDDDDDDMIVATLAGIIA